jgi:hypothetical protein
MKTSNFFDLDRFIGLLKQDILFNYKFYLAFLLGLSIGIYLVSYMIIRNLSAGFLSVNNILYNLLLGATMVFIGMSFPSFRTQINTSNFLLTPGSAFEKLLVQFMVRFVIFIPLALIILKVGVFLAIFSMVPDPKTGFDPLFVEDLSFSKLFTFQNNILRDLSYLFFAFAGSAYFKRYAVIKTMGAFIFLPVTIFLIVKLTGNQMNWNKISLDYLDGSRFFLSLAPLCIGVLLLSLPWVYFNIKEKEL